MKLISGICVFSFVFCICAAGCSGPAVSKDAKTTFLNSDDMVTMTNQMASSMMGDSYVQREMAKGPLTVVIKPVENQTNEIIVDNRKELFVNRLQGLLAGQPALRDKFVWVMNKSDFEKLRAEEVPDVGPSEERIQPEYALWAIFLADTQATSKGRSDLYLCQYKLTNLLTGEELWTGQYETSKTVKKALLD